ncbi:hypothetical protein BGZ83_005048 [Gryganskiella cystojenkinii]|nr:hypothetical protein BGZ83_005048 [Gryganskiella cystojenkinii]
MPSNASSRTKTSSLLFSPVSLAPNLLSRTHSKPSTHSIREFTSVLSGILDHLLGQTTAERKQRKREREQQRFKPLLGKGLKPGARMTSVELEAAKNRIELNKTPVCIGLVRFRYTSQRELPQDVHLDQLVRILNDNSLIQELQFHVDLMTQRTDELIPILTELPLLATLTSIHIQGDKNGELKLLPETLNFFSHLFGLPYLTTLRFSFATGLDPEIEFSTYDEADLFDQTLESLQRHRLNCCFPFQLQELELPDHDQLYPQEFILVFLQLGFQSLVSNGTYMEELDWDYEIIAIVLEFTHPSDLRPLEFTEMQWERLRGPVLQHYSFLKSLVIHNAEHIHSADIQVI